MNVNWQPRRIIEHQYRQALQKLMQCLGKLVEGLDLTDPEQVLNAFRRYVTTDFFTALANAAASRMVTALRVEGAKTWREAAREGTRGRMIYRALQNELAGPVGARALQLVNENGLLISSLPDGKIGQICANFIKRETFRGRRAEFIAKDLAAKFPELTRGQVKLIARTEASKASTALTRSRSESLGLDWYVWRTSKDARVRDSHHIMDGVLVNWHDPPNPERLDGQKKVKHGPYHAGNVWNCRCYPEPLIRLDQVKWPAKVYTAGSIKTMTRTDFERLSGMRKAA